MSLATKAAILALSVAAPFTVHKLYSTLSHALRSRIYDIQESARKEGWSEGWDSGWNAAMRSAWFYRNLERDMSYSDFMQIHSVHH